MTSWLAVLALGAAGCADPPIERIAFGSCAMQWEPQPIWDTIAATEPDLFLFLGDAIYGDWDGEDVYDVTDESLRREWGKLGEIPEFRRFRESVPVLATWDNHDYGKHDGGADFALKEVARAAFLDFFREPADSPRRSRAGIYDAHVYGPPGRRVQLILLDTRFSKSPFLRDARSKEEKAELGIVGNYLPNEGSAATILGAEQWAWLDQQLREPAEVRFLVSGTQIVADQKGMDEWGNFPRERERLFALIESTGAEGVIFLSGNVHFAEVSRYDGGPFPLVDFTSSGMTHVDERYAALQNPYRITGPFVEHNFGLVEIDWDASTGPVVTLRAIGVAGATAFEHRIRVSSLRH